MSINRLGYYIKEGFVNLFKNKRSTFASIVIMSFTLLLVGIFYVVNRQISSTITYLEETQPVEVFLEPTIKEAEIEELRQQISSLEIDGRKIVVNIQYKSQEEATEQLGKQFEGNSTLLEAFKIDGKIDFLPPSFILKLDSLEDRTYLKAQIEGYDKVKEVKIEEELIEIITTTSKFINGSIIVITVVLLFSSIFIISNTIKLTVYSRRKEIEIMKYVGATNEFVKGPFLVESIFMGILSTILPIILLVFLYTGIEEFLGNVQSEIQVGQTTAIVTENITTMLPELTVIFLVLGIGLGILGSSLSMKRYLEV